MPTAPTKGNGDRLVEWLFACMMIGWGTYLMLPIDTFAAPQYLLLAGIAPENVWGAIAVSIGSLRITALFINGSWRRTPLLRFVGSWVGVMWWITMSFLLVSGPEHVIPAGVVFYPIFVVFEGISCWRSSVDAYHSGALRPARGVRSAA